MRIPWWSFGSSLVLLEFLSKTVRVDGTWTLFDFVRPWKGAWGSESDVPYRKIGAFSGNGPTSVGNGSQFGWSMTNLGDLDGDGVDDLAVGAPGEPNTYLNGSGYANTETRSGAVYILFMSTNGTVKSSTRVGGMSNGGPMLYSGDEFGYSVAGLGDLDGDGVLDMAVGAPGTIISSVYIMFLYANGTCRSNVLIRGQYTGTVQIVRRPDGSWPNTSYIPNGPDLSYSSRLGTALATIGDWDKDGIPDLAASINNAAGGQCSVYLLFLDRNGTVRNYTELAPGVNGGPVVKIPDAFSTFGTSILMMPDHDGDGVPELIIGAKRLDDSDTAHFRSGVLFFCFMNADGTIKSVTRISELSDASSAAGPLPLMADDNCGNGVAQIGDINKDDMRQHWPTIRSPKADDRPPVTDIIIGCPQSNTEKSTGRIFMLFLTPKANVKAFRLLPSATDTGIAPAFRPRAQVGASMVSIMDLDANGLKEIVVGAPGDDEAGRNSGVIYVFYFRRRRWHPFVPDTRGWLCTIIIPPSIAIFFCISTIIYFCIKFRRKPDEIELMVKAAGVEIGAKTAKIKKKRKKGGGGGEEEGKVYADDF